MVLHLCVFAESTKTGFAAKLKFLASVKEKRVVVRFSALPFLLTVQVLLLIEERSFTTLEKRVEGEVTPQQ